MVTQPEGYTREQLEGFEGGWQQLNLRIGVSDVAGPPRVWPPREEKTIRYKPAIWPVPPQNLKKNLEKYRKLALNMGATDAKIVSTKDIPQDLRARYVGCLNPGCRWLNTNYHCPMVRVFPFEEMEEFFADYQYAIAFKVLPPVMDDSPDVGKIDLDIYYTLGGGEAPDKSMLARNIIRLRILSEMERRIRAAAYYDGYMMAAPIGSGPCLVTKCSDIGRCPVLKGGICRSAEVQPVGSGCAFIDYFTLARRISWGEIQLGGNCAFPEDVPNPEQYYNIGLVLIE